MNLFFCPTCDFPAWYTFLQQEDLSVSGQEEEEEEAVSEDEEEEVGVIQTCDSCSLKKITLNNPPISSFS